MKLIFLSPNLHLVFSLEQKKLLEENFEVEYYEAPCPIQSILSLGDDSEKIVAIDPDFCDWKVTREDIDSMKNVKAICLQTTAFHYIDWAYLKDKNIPLMNLRGFSTNAVAEQAIGMMFALARKVPIVIREWFQVNFERYRGIEISGKKVGIIWLGRIWKRIAELTSGLDMQVSYWSENSRDERYNYSELVTLLGDSDIIIHALARNDATEKLITEELFSHLKPSVLFVTIAHINHEMMIRLSETGKIAWYASDKPIGKLEDFQSNIFPWAELGWCTEESFRRNGEQSIAAILDAKDSKYPTQVNL